jgi:glutathione peroxidase
MKLQKKAGREGAIKNGKEVPPAKPFHGLQVQLNNTKTLDLTTLKGKKVLIVNTASNCGYTEQYAELQKLYEQHKGKLEIIGFPANDFKEQEKGSDEEIASFCQLNYGVTFPLAKKASVVKGEAQHPVFTWLSDPQQNGWNRQQPEWNFSKYLVSENGVLTHYFPPGLSPLDEEVVKAVEK